MCVCCMDSQRQTDGGISGTSDSDAILMSSTHAVGITSMLRCVRAARNCVFVFSVCDTMQISRELPACRCRGAARCFRRIFVSFHACAIRECVWLEIGNAGTSEYLNKGVEILRYLCFIFISICVNRLWFAVCFSARASLVSLAGRFSSVRRAKRKRQRRSGEGE